jgi:ribokinase
LACAVASGKPLVEAVREANLVGALSVTKLGAQPSLPTAEELRNFEKK